MDCYEAVSGARMHAAYYRPVVCIVICQTKCRSIKLVVENESHS